MTPFGGVAVFISFLDKIGLTATLRQHMPIQWRSRNHIDPTTTFTAFLVSVLVGARRFAHASLLRGDRALRALSGMGRFPTDDTIRNLFGAFGMGQVQRLYEATVGMADATTAAVQRGLYAGPGFNGTGTLRPPRRFAERTQPAQTRKAQPSSAVSRVE